MSDNPGAAPAAAVVDPKAPVVAADPAKPGEPPKGLTPAEKKIWKLKANGKEVDFDGSDEERVKRAIEKGLGADETFQTAAQMRKQAEHFVHLLRTNPKAILTNPNLGIDIKKIAEEIVWEQIQEQSLTPEQKKQRDTQRELDKYKDDEKKQKEAAEAQEAQELHQKYAADYDKRMSDALTAAHVPKTPATVKRMAFYMMQAVQHGYDLQPSDVVERVRQDYIEEVKALFGQTDGDKLMEILGEDVAKKVRESDLKRLKNTQGNQFHTPEPKAGKPKEKPKKLGAAEWRESVRKGFLGK